MMADFGVNATNLSAPSRAGDSPVSYSPAPIPQSNTVGLLGGLVDMFAKGASALGQIDAQKQKNTLLSDIAQKEAKLNLGVQNGEISPQEASVRSRANFNSTLAAYPAMASDITQLYSSFKATTVTGDREDSIKSTREQAIKTREKENDDMRTAGYIITPTTSDAERAIIWNSFQDSRAADRKLKAYQAEVRWHRENTDYDQKQLDRDLKFKGLSLMTDIAGSQLNSVNAEMTSLLNSVTSGKMTPEEANLQWNNRMASINGTLVAAAASTGDPSVASSYRTLFDQSDALFKKMVDPKSDKTKWQTELSEFKARQQLALIQQNPEARALATTTTLFGNQPVLSAAAAKVTDTAFKQVSEGLLYTGSTPVSNGQPTKFVPQVVGNPNVEPGVIEGLREGVKQIRAGNPKNKEAATIEASNSVNNILVQTGKMIDSGVQPASLKGVANFFSSPEYAYMVQHGQIDRQAAQTAKKVFQLTYEPAVVDAIGNKLGEKVETSDGKFAPLAASLEVKWNGAGFEFSAIKGSKAVNAITDLKKTEAGLTQIVRLGAHMEGSTDYEKYWEANKHLFLPSVFPDPARLKVGDVVQGRKYIGGNVSNPNNWVMQIPK